MRRSKRNEQGFKQIPWKSAQFLRKCDISTHFLRSGSGLYTPLLSWVKSGMAKTSRMRSLSSLDSSADHSSRSMDSLFSTSATLIQEQEEQWPIPNTVAGPQETTGTDDQDETSSIASSTEVKPISMLECLCCGFSDVNPCGLFFQFGSVAGIEKKTPLSFSMSFLLL
jgi:hypothetical protein